MNAPASAIARRTPRRRGSARGCRQSGRRRGFMKMPEPTMPPMTSMVASKRPRRRTNPGFSISMRRAYRNFVSSRQPPTTTARNAVTRRRRTNCRPHDHPPRDFSVRPAATARAGACPTEGLARRFGEGRVPACLERLQTARVGPRRAPTPVRAPQTVRRFAPDDPVDAFDTMVLMA